jgi:ribosomal 50S subunit-recycling heat shock protein
MRLDVLVGGLAGCESRTVAAQLIKAGAVTVNGSRIKNSAVMMNNNGIKKRCGDDERQRD